jgi:hypothetical protein
MYFLKAPDIRMNNSLQVWLYTLVLTNILITQRLVFKNNSICIYISHSLCLFQTLYLMTVFKITTERNKIVKKGNSCYSCVRKMLLLQVQSHIRVFTQWFKICDIKVKYPCTGRGGPCGYERLRLPHFSDIRLTDDGKVVRPTRRPLFTPRKIPGTHIC